MPTYYGSTLAITQGTVIEWDFTGGQTEVHRWKGVAASVKALYDDVVTGTGYDQLSYDPGRGVASLEGRVAVAGPVTVGGTNSSTTYELYEIQVMKPILSHPYFAELTANQVKDVRAAVEKGLSVAQAGLGQKQSELLEMLLKNTTEYFESAYELRITYRGDRRNTYFTAAYEGVNTASAGAAPPTQVGSILGTLPANTNWLKRVPRINRAGAFWELAQTWWGIPTQGITGAGWSSILYGGSGTP